MYINLPFINHPHFDFLPFFLFFELFGFSIFSMVSSFGFSIGRFGQQQSQQHPIKNDNTNNEDKTNNINIASTINIV